MVSFSNHNLRHWNSTYGQLEIYSILTGGPRGPVGPASPSGPCSPCFGDRKNATNLKSVFLHNAKLFIFLDLLNKINDLTGLPEFPIKPGTPGGPLLPC